MIEIIFLRGSSLDITFRVFLVEQQAMSYVNCRVLKPPYWSLVLFGGF